MQMLICLKLEANNIMIKEKFKYIKNMNNSIENSLIVFKIWKKYKNNKFNFKINKFKKWIENKVFN
jgi:hypothetical protein